MKNTRAFLTSAFIGCLLAACSDNESPATSDIDDDVVPLDRLSHQVEPTHYLLNLTIDPKADHFNGEATITVQVNKPTRTVWLHGKSLSVASLSALDASGNSIVGQYQQAADIGVARLRFERELPKGLAEIKIKYQAAYNTNLEGLYKVRSGGEDYVFSKFSAVSARLAFPGFDEPGFKVPFDIWLEVNPDDTAVTSTPATEYSNLPNGRKLIRFQTSKPMPTYLMSFAVGPLDQLDADPIPTTALRDFKIPLAAYSVKGKGEELQYALDNTTSIVTTLENYFGYSYPYEKLALIAVPDYTTAARENAGAIVYREKVLLQSEQNSALLRELFLSVHAHELSHQWFGNLVTPKWWDDVWLNEAFATWMAAKTMNQLKPDTGYDLARLNGSLSSMQLDQLVSARKIRQPVTSYAEIGAAFDDISYGKGGAVLSMFETFVGEDEFKQGIQNYMRKHRYANADARDFVQAIAETRPDLPKGQVEKAFFSFLDQPGIPLVDLNWQCKDQKTTVTVEQSRYLPIGSPGERDKTWDLPLCVSFDDAGEMRQQCELIEDRKVEFSLDSDVCPSYIIANADAAGYYMWSQSAEQWQQLLDSGALNASELLAAVNSISAAFHAGTLSVRDYFSLLPSIIAKVNFWSVSTPLADLVLIRQEMLLPEQHPQFDRLLADLFLPLYQRVGPDKTLTDSNDIRLRIAIYDFYALTLEDQALRQHLHDQAVSYIDADDKQAGVMDMNTRKIALTVAVQMEDRAFADRLLNRFSDSRDPILREEILEALAHSNDAAVIENLTALALSDDLRDTEVENIIQPLMANTATREKTWEWVQGNIDGLIERLPGWSQGQVINYGAQLCQATYAAQIETDLGDKISALGWGPRSLANTLEKIQLCDALVQHHASAVRSFLE